MKRKRIKNPRFTSINTKTSGLFGKVMSHLLLLFSRQAVESRAHELAVGCRAKPRFGLLNHSPAVWFGAVVGRISIQITILPVRHKQGKVVTGCQNFDWHPRHSNILAPGQDESPGFELFLDQGGLSTAHKEQGRGNSRWVCRQSHSNFKCLAPQRCVSKLIGPIPFNRIIQATPSQACSTHLED